MASSVGRLVAFVVVGGNRDGVGLAVAGVAGELAGEVERAAAAGASTVPTSQSRSPASVP